MRWLRDRPQRLHRRRRFRDPGRRPRSRPSLLRAVFMSDERVRPQLALARAIPCASRPACRSTATTSTKAYRPIEGALELRNRAEEAASSAGDMRGAGADAAREFRRAICPAFGWDFASFRALRRAKGTDITDEAGAPIGIVTSGGFAPEPRRFPLPWYLSRPRFRSAGHAPLKVIVRGNRLQTAEVVEMPFVPHRYHPQIPSPILPSLRSLTPCIFPRTMSGSTSKATSPRSASPPTRPSSLGDVVFVDLPDAGKVLIAARRGPGGRGERQGRFGCLSRRSSGEVIADQRSALSDTPETVNESARETSGWFVKVKLSRSGRDRRR